MFTCSASDVGRFYQMGRDCACLRGTRLHTRQSPVGSRTPGLACLVHSATAQRPGTLRRRAGDQSSEEPQRRQQGADKGGAVGSRAAQAEGGSEGGADRNWRAAPYHEGPHDGDGGADLGERLSRSIPCHWPHRTVRCGTRGRVTRRQRRRGGAARERCAHLDGHHEGHLGGDGRVEEGQEGVDRRHNVMQEQRRCTLDAVLVERDPREVSDEVEHRCRPEDAKACGALWGLASMHSRRPKQSMKAAQKRPNYPAHGRASQPSDIISE